MRVSKSREKSRPAQPRAERLREIPECAGTGEVPEPLTAVRARGYRRCRPAVPRRAVVVSFPAEPVPHVHAGQATPGRPLTAPPLRPDRPDHLQACGFVQMRLHDGIDAGLLTVICERTRERQAIRAGRRMRSPDVLEVLGGRAVVRGVAEHIRPGNGPESAARVAREWSGMVGGQDSNSHRSAPTSPAIPITLASINMIGGKLRQTHHFVAWRHLHGYGWVWNPDRLKGNVPHTAVWNRHLNAGGLRRRGGVMEGTKILRDTSKRRGRGSVEPVFSITCNTAPDAERGLRPTSTILFSHIMTGGCLLSRPDSHCGV